MSKQWTGPFEWVSGVAGAAEINDALNTLARLGFLEIDEIRQAGRGPVLLKMELELQAEGEATTEEEQSKVDALDDALDEEDEDDCVECDIDPTLAMEALRRINETYVKSKTILASSDLDADGRPCRFTFHESDCAVNKPIHEDGPCNCSPEYPTEFKAGDILLGPDGKCATCYGSGFVKGIGGPCPSGCRDASKA